MSELELLNLIQSSLGKAARGEEVTSVESWACDELYHAQDPVIRAVVKRAATPSVDVDDLAQEVWLVLTRRLRNLKLDPSRGTLDAWVATVARRHCSKVVRRRSWHHDEPLTAEMVSLLLDPNAGPSAELEQEQRRQQVKAAIAELCKGEPTRNRQIIVRYWLEGQPPAAIAAELDLSSDSVGAVLRRARLKLAKLLRQAGM
jgi:RNA polymerase sigma factor (sigma-70 family)